MSDDDDRAPGDLPRRLSHAMRSPLGVISGALHQHDPDLDPAMRARMLEIAARAATKLEHLADRLSLMGRVQGDREPVVAVCDVVEVARAAVTRIETLRGRRGVAVEIGDCPAVANVIGDAQLLAAAIAELVDNAVRFAKSRVQVDVHVDAREVRLLVGDDGGQVDPDQVEAAWPRDKPLSDRTGLGIGLWLARSIARRHDGDVRLADADGATVFALTLPAT